MTGEILLFARALWYGAALLAVYDCLRVLRRTVRHRGWVVAVEDLFYWIGAGFFYFRRPLPSEQRNPAGLLFCGDGAGDGTLLLGNQPVFCQIRFCFAEMVQRNPENTGESRKKSDKKVEICGCKG